jgi:hypothetical protein
MAQHLSRPGRAGVAARAGAGARCASTQVKASKCLQISGSQIYMSDPLRKVLARSF